MHWFGGTIAEAVTISKQKNAIFVVFVEGDNDLSKELATTIDDAAVLKRLADETNFLAIKLKSGSANYTYFAQIYQFVPVPSLFFIGRNGTPLEVVCAGVEPQNLAERIDRILDDHYKEKPSSMQPSTSKQNIKEQTSNLLQSETAANEKTASTQPKQSDNASEPETSGPAAKIAKTAHNEAIRSGTEYEVVCDGDVCVRKPKSGPDVPGPSHRDVPVDADTQMEAQPVEEPSADVNADEKIERAKELIEARRREKAEKEKELERQKELERRATGQGVAELKRWQAEQELKQIQDERKREKLENNLARQRILEQIAQDRAERRARDLPQPTVTTPSATEPTATTPPATQLQTSGDGSSRARVQFKMADGESHTAHFESTATVAELHRYVADNLQMSRSSFSLWTAFPRLELTENDATLRDLHLVPSAALLVLPRRTAVVSSSPSPFSSLIAFFTQLFSTMILDPSYQLYSWLRSRLFPQQRGSTPSTRGPNPPGPNPPGSNPQGIRRRGNVHRLTGDRPDDDNNTWNGNSTQQM